MSPSQPDVVAARPLAGPQESQDQEGATPPAATRPEQRAQARDIVRLFQCRLCSRPLQEPVSLPCGRSICKQCLPQSHLRLNISYPAVPERLQGFQCPFDDCGREHAVGDCGFDVILSKTTELVKDNIERGKTEAAKTKVSTRIAVRDEWEIAGIPSLRQASTTSETLSGGRLVATWSMAEKGQLEFDAEVVYHDMDGRSGGPDFAEFELEALHQVQDAARTEMDCQICYALFFDPLTTPCGHTFCRSCLHRILDHSLHCPICRRKLAMNPLLNRTSCPPNEKLDLIIETFWKDELNARRGILEAEETGRQESLNIPLFICTLSFPMVPTFLHIFEPRYRLMIRRAVESNRMFGMVLPRRSRYSGDRDFYDLGTLLRIVNVQYYPDGRSLIETMGVSRFRVVEHGMLDGYTVGKTDRIDDVSLEEEEALEAREVSPTVSPAVSPQTESATDENGLSAPGQPSRNPTLPEKLEDIATLSTKKLLDFALDFVARMGADSVPWLTERTRAIYGECPDDPAIFPWWLASMLPVRELEKYKLLETSSVRERLKICCRWILEWEASAWSFRGCTIL